MAPRIRAPRTTGSRAAPRPAGAAPAQRWRERALDIPLSPNDWVTGHSDKGETLMTEIENALGETHPNIDIRAVVETYTTGYQESMKPRYF